MLIIEDINKCTGCSACMNVCPKNAIEMKPDKYGFCYPSIVVEKCVNCDMCKKVCPINAAIEKNKEQKKVVACYSKFDEERLKSSSGGIFSLLARNVIEDGGIVCGVKIDDKFIVRHCCANSLIEIEEFKGSKYVQSEIGYTYKEIGEYLKQSKKVLFSGTPCQVAGLKSYLGESYETLTCVDFICFGIPSPKVFQKYLNALVKKKGKSIKNVNFRSKVNGWTGKKFSFEVVYSDNSSESEIITKDLYHRTFFTGLNVRNSCYSCKFTDPNKLGDLTLADFWGVEELMPHMDDGIGTSISFINTEKGSNVLNEIKNQIKFEYIDYKIAIEQNKAAITSVKLNPKREVFFDEIIKDHDDENILNIMKVYTKVTLFSRTINYIKKITKFN